MDLSLLKIIPGVASTQNVAANAVAGQSPPLNNICDGLIPLSPIPQLAGGGIEQLHAWQLLHLSYGPW